MLGGSFPRQAIEAISDIDPILIDGLLSSLVRKEVLTVRADKLSPERGQYAFTQSLIRSVAYDMLTRAERKTRHLRTAEHLQSAFPDEGAEVAEVIAAHLHDAYKATRDDDGAEELRTRACRSYALAAERAEAVGALESAEAAYLKAVELTSDEAEQATFTGLAGRMAMRAGWNDRARDLLETATTAHGAAGRVLDAARTTGWLAHALSGLGKGELALVQIREALASLEGTTAPAAVVAELRSSLGLILTFAGHRDEAAVAIEETLILAQHHRLDETLAEALDSKATLFNFAGRNDEARALYELSIAVGRRVGGTRSELRSEANLADLCMTRDLPGAEDHAKAALALSRRSGERASESQAASNLMYVLTDTGRLDEAVELGTELLEAGDKELPGAEGIHFRLAHIEALRGHVDAARRHVSMCGEESDDVQYRGMYAAAEAAVVLSGGDHRRALEAARSAIELALEGGLGLAHEVVRDAFPIAIEAAVEIGDLEAGELLAESVAIRPPGEVPPFLRAQVTRAKALVAGARGDAADVEKNLVVAEAAFSELGYPYWIALVQLERAEWLAGQGRLGESSGLAGEAAATFERIGAAPMLARGRALLAPEIVRSHGIDGGFAAATSHSSPSE